MDKISLNLKCLKCGGAPFIDEDSPTDSSIVKCKACGQFFGTYGEVKAKGTEVAASEIRRALKPAFDRLAKLLKH